MKPTPRPAVQKLGPVHHGSLDFRELEERGLSPDEIIDFSVNSNPYGPLPAAVKALRDAPVARYPDPESLALRRALASHHAVDPDQILPGNGSLDLLWMLALSYLEAGERVLILTPTFGEYTRAAAMMGASIEVQRASEENNFDPDINSITRRLGEGDYKIAFICNPNNPTGRHISRKQISSWAEDHPGTIFVVDEAYIGFATGMGSAITLSHPNLLVLRSMTKDHALAGLRLGYAVGASALIETLTRVRAPWNVNSFAQAAGLASMKHAHRLQDQIQRLTAAKRSLVTALRNLGYSVLDSRTHFFLMEVGDGARFRDELLDYGLQVRDCASFGLPHFVRISTRKPDANQRLLSAIREAFPPPGK